MFTYDHENQLSSVATDTASTLEASRWKVEFVYDGQGRLRVKRDYTWDTTSNQWSLSAETRYLDDGLLLVQERSSVNTPTVTYTRGRDLSGSLAGAGGIGGLLARSHGYSGGNWSSHTFYHADGNGTVTALVNSGGVLQASYKYDPYGRYLSGGGSLASANGLRFSSKPWVGFAGSTTSGLYSYGYRFYDPYLQRWVNRDPIGETGSLNLYTFCLNGATIRVDTDGRISKKWPLFGGGVSAALTAAWCIWRSETACDRWRDAKLAAGRAEANIIAAGNSQQHQEGSLADALAHCIASCKLAREPGPCGTAQRGLDSLQRRENPEQLGSRMDMWNNMIGATLPGSGEQNCGRDCTKALNAGGLATIDWDRNEVVPFPPREYFPIE